ncbi:MAG: serine/threonine protein kinase [Victivallaceae bacterium]|nr:serine/threonine protein kinase [Victivallaceae bacterium]
MDNSEGIGKTGETQALPQKTVLAENNIHATQKIDIDVKELIGESSLLTKTRIRKRILKNFAPRKSIFSKKYIPDDYVKSDSQVSIINSIPKLENQLQLQDITSNYSLKEQIAEGSQGTVWSAFDKSLRRDIIVKSSKSPGENEDPRENKNSFVAEARIMAQLDHPSIAPIYGMYSGINDKLHLTMKHIHGQTLRDYLENLIVLYERDGIAGFDEKRSIATRIDYLIKVCEAVDYAHCKGVIHRDLKPENIIIGNHSEVYVMDWGLACLLKPEEITDETHMTEIGRHMRNELVGTPCYMASELIRGGLCNQQSDIFSLGMILFEIVTLEKAALGETVRDVLRNIVCGNYRSFRHRFLKSRLPDDLKAIFIKATCNSLSRRYQSAHDLARDLKNYLRRNETTARPDNLPRKWLRAISNHSFLASLAISGSLLCLTVIIIYGLHSKNTLITAQKTRESMLAHFQNMVFESANDLDYAFAYFQSKLIDAANRAEYVFGADKTMRAGITFSGPDPDKKTYVYSASYGARLNLRHALLYDENGKALDPETRNMLALSEILKHMLLTGNARFNHRKWKFVTQAMLNGEAPLARNFIAFRDGTVLAYPGEEKYVKIYAPQKRQYCREAFDKDGLSWSPPFRCPDRPQIFISCFHKISGRSSREKAVIGMDINLEYIRKYLLNNPVPGIKKYIITRKGDIIAANYFDYKTAQTDPKTNAVILKKFPFLKEFRETIIAKSLQFKVLNRGRTYILSMRHIVPLDYYYIEQISESDLKKEHWNHAH